ncbi:glycoside hydrolase superfamily [Chytriomyces sp. MP71]|nr:glycoside hydrolase superfamily [Chytriomyces sp. MP71]
MGRTAAGPSQYVTLLNNLSTPPSAPSTPNSGSNTPFPIPSPIPAPANPSIPSPKKAVYIDAWANGAAGFNVPGYTTNDYNIILLSFWTWGAGAVDMVQSWTQLDAATREKYVAAFHEAGKLVMVSAFGSTEFPTGQDPVAVATKLAKFVTDYRLDGADVDWEDSAAFQNGTGEAWLITFTITLRKLLPSPKYAISHAPQAPYFVNDKKIYPNGAYLTVDKKAGSAIDWYNVQFYNQGDNRYDTCTTLLNTSGGPFPGTSIFEINALGVDLNKLVIGKPIATAGVSNTGLMDVGALAACLVQAKGKGWRAGVMGWQLSLDPEGAWIHTLSASL